MPLCSPVLLKEVPNAKMSALSSSHRLQRLDGRIGVPLLQEAILVTPARSIPPIAPQVSEPAPSAPDELQFVFESPVAHPRQFFNKKKKPKPWWDFFDLGFHHYLTPIIIKIIWALCLGLAALSLASAGLFAISSMIPESKAQSQSSNSQYDSQPTFRPPTHPSALEETSTLVVYKVLGWIGLAIVTAITLLVIRVICESIIVLFNIAESLTSIDKKTAKA